MIFSNFMLFLDTTTENAISLYQFIFLTHIHSYLNKFPDSNNFFVVNNTVQDILVTGIGSIHGVTSEGVLLS